MRWVSYSFYLVHSTFKGDNPTYVISLKYFNIGLYLYIYEPISFKAGMMIETTNVYILISF